MMEWTDRHCRFFHRLLTRRALLYTEMLTTGAVLHGDRTRLLRYDAAEHPLALQLGGSEPRALAACARIGADLGFDEINLNAGCPSDRVQDGRFGACLMAEPALVGDCVAAMKAAVAIPVTVKCRIGIDEQDPEQALEVFAQAVERAGADALIVHARKAWLKGLSPKENREVPPLDYERVYRLKARASAAHGRAQWRHRQRRRGACASRPCRRRHDGPRRLSGAVAASRRRSAGVRRAPRRSPRRKRPRRRSIPYIERELAQGTRLHAITRHLHGLFRAVPGARAFRRHLAGAASAPQAGAEFSPPRLRLVARRGCDLAISRTLPLSPKLRKAHVRNRS